MFTSTYLGFGRAVIGCAEFGLEPDGVVGGVQLVTVIPDARHGHDVTLHLTHGAAPLTLHRLETMDRSATVNHDHL